MENGPQLPFGRLLRIFRIRKMLSIEELGKKAGVSPQYIGMLESGKRNRTGFRVMRSLCDALELDGDDRRVLVDSVVVPAIIQLRADEEILARMKTAKPPALAEQEQAFLERCRTAVGTSVL